MASSHSDGAHPRLKICASLTRSHPASNSLLLLPAGPQRCVSCRFSAIIACIFRCPRIRSCCIRRHERMPSPYHSRMPSPCHAGYANVPFVGISKSISCITSCMPPVSCARLHASSSSHPPLFGHFACSSQHCLHVTQHFTNISTFSRHQFFTQFPVHLRPGHLLNVTVPVTTFTHSKTPLLPTPKTHP